jgi:hypothetical protein
MATRFHFLSVKTVSLLLLLSLLDEILPQLGKIDFAFKFIFGLDVKLISILEFDASSDLECVESLAFTLALFAVNSETAKSADSFGLDILSGRCSLLKNNVLWKLQLILFFLL